MNYDYRYQLESFRVTGHRPQKTICPRCGRNKCFVRYVDTHNMYNYLGDDVGRCDHENSCGYHYTPREYFKDHPWLKDNSEPNYFASPKIVKPIPPKPQLQPLPIELVDKSHSPHSNFWKWFSNTCLQNLKISQEHIERTYMDYRIGATKCGEIIFWQIDEQQRVRTGHIMQYGSDGHRIQTPNWIHSIMIERGSLQKNFVLQQCFFGQHLLSKYPNKKVCIVESEKTAIFMAALYPELLWLATCGSSGLNVEKLECLRGRRIIVFPDSACFQKWKKILEQTQGLNYYIDDKLEKYASNTDLVDLLLQPQ